MRYITFALSLFLSFFATGARAQVDEPEQGAEAIVTLQVAGIDDAAWQQFTARVGKEHGANVEYSCLRAGIIVLRMQQLTVTEKADVITLVKRLLSEAGIMAPAEFLHVYLERQAWNKC